MHYRILLLRQPRRHGQHMRGRSFPRRRCKTLLDIEFALFQRTRNTDVAVNLVCPLVDIPWIGVVRECLPGLGQRTVTAAQTELAVAESFGDGQAPPLVNRWVERKQACPVKCSEIGIGTASERNDATGQPAIGGDLVDQVLPAVADRTDQDQQRQIRNTPIDQAREGAAKRLLVLPVFDGRYTEQKSLCNDFRYLLADVIGRQRSQAAT